MSTTAPRVRPALSSAAVRYVLILCVGLGAVALFLLATASGNSTLFADQYPLLLVLNGAVVLMMTGLVVYQLLTLRRKLKSGVFGAKLTLRLVMLFALMAVLPGALIWCRYSFWHVRSTPGSRCAWTRRSRAASISAAARSTGC